MRRFTMRRSAVRRTRSLRRHLFRIEFRHFLLTGFRRFFRNSFRLCFGLCFRRFCFFRYRFDFLFIHMLVLFLFLTVAQLYDSILRKM